MNFYMENIQISDSSKKGCGFCNLNGFNFNFIPSFFGGKKTEEVPQHLFFGEKHKQLPSLGPFFSAHFSPEKKTR